MNYLPSAQVPKQRKTIDTIIHAAYPEFLLHDAISTLYWNKLFTDFAAFQLILMIKRTVRAIGNAVPLYCNDYNNFKVDGWDWALREAHSQFEKQVKPNTLVGLSIAVANDRQGKGYSQDLLLQFKTVAKENGFRKLIIPIRPTCTHEKLGAKRICICANAMTVQGRMPCPIIWQSCQDISWIALSCIVRP